MIRLYNRKLGQHPEELLDQAAMVAEPGIDLQELDSSTTVLSDAIRPRPRWPPAPSRVAARWSRPTASCCARWSVRGGHRPGALPARPEQLGHHQPRVRPVRPHRRAESSGRASPVRGRLRDRRPPHAAGRAPGCPDPQPQRDAPRRPRLRRGDDGPADPRAIPVERRVLLFAAVDVAGHPHLEGRTIAESFRPGAWRVLALDTASPEGRRPDLAPAPA